MGAVYRCLLACVCGVFEVGVKIGKRFLGFWVGECLGVGFYGWAVAGAAMLVNQHQAVMVIKNTSQL